MVQPAQWQTVQWRIMNAALSSARQTVLATGAIGASAQMEGQDLMGWNVVQEAHKAANTLSPQITPPVDVHVKQLCGTLTASHKLMQARLTHGHVTSRAVLNLAKDPGVRLVNVRVQMSKHLRQSCPLHMGMATLPR